LGNALITAAVDSKDTGDQIAGATRSRLGAPGFRSGRTEIIK
jgi:hypothetical protein